MTKKIFLLLLIAVMNMTAKAQKFDFNYLQSGSITFVEWFNDELKGLGKTEPINCYVEFLWNEKNLKVIGKTDKGDILFEFSKEKGNIFNFDYSEKAIFIGVGKSIDIKDGSADGIAEFQIIPKEKKFDVFSPPMENAESEHHELIRFIYIDASQEQVIQKGYDELLKKLQSCGFNEEYWY
jgi:hypothetical protein